MSRRLRRGDRVIIEDGPEAREYSVVGASGVLRAVDRSRRNEGLPFKVQVDGMSSVLWVESVRAAVPSEAEQEEGK